MRRMKSTLALLLALCLLLGMLPVTALAADGASIVVTPIDGRTCTSATDGVTTTTVYGLKFTATVPGGIDRMSVLIAFDSGKIQPVMASSQNQYYQDANTTDESQDKSAFELTGKAATSVFGDTKYDTQAAAWKNVGSKSTVQYSIAHQGGATNTAETQDMFNFYYRLQDGVELEDLTAGSIQIITDPNTAEYQAQYDPVKTPDYGARLQAIGGTVYSVEPFGSNQSLSLSVTHPGSGNKDDYAGTEASKPTVASKQGGKVTLNANAAIEGETVEYAYSTTSTAPETGWQPGTMFTDVPAGTVYFFARVQETDLHKAGEAIASDPVTIYSAPSLSYGAVNGTVNTAIASVSPNLDGGSGGGTYTVKQGTQLPEDLSIDPSTGVISGMPAAGGQGTFTVVYTDSEGQTAEAEVSYNISKRAVTTDMLEFELTAQDYDGSEHPVSVTAREVGVGTITVKYNGETVAPKNAGTYTVTVDVTATDTHDAVTGLELGTLTINPKTLTASDLEYTGAAISKTYNGTTACDIASGVTVKSGSLVSGDSLEVTVTNAVYDSKDVATATKVTFTVAAITEGNYRLAETTLDHEANITPAGYTANAADQQNAVVGVGTFTAPTFTGVGGETVNGTLTYTYNQEGEKSAEEIIAALKQLNKGETAQIGWSFTAAAGGNYAAAPKTGTITITMVDIIFQVDGATATAENGVTIKDAPTYGDSWNEIVTIGNIVATVDGDPVQGGYALNVSGTPASGEQSYTVLFTATGADAEKYTNVEVFSGTVNVAKKAITVTADDKTKVYGAANPALTWSVDEDDLEGEDTEAVLNVELTCAADTNSPAGTPVAITGTGTADNYTITVEPGQMTITKATIASVTWNAESPVIYANSESNNAEGLKTAAGLEGTVSVTLDSGKTETLSVTWGDAQGTYDPKGGTYTFQGTLETGDNINTYAAALEETLTVKPVTGTISQVDGSAATALTSPVVVAQGKAQAATAYTDFKLPASIQLTFTADGTTVDPATYDNLTWSVPLDTLKGKAVNSTTDVTITSIPPWVTIDESVLTVQVQITDKYPVNVTVTQSGTTFGTPLADPVATQVADEDGIDEGEVSWNYLYEGTTAAGQSYRSEQAPTDAGTYTVTATLVSDTHAGSGTSAEFTIEPKSISGATVTLPEDYAPVYTGSALTPTVTVMDGETALVANTDYTVAYSNNTNAGQATVTITGQGNYKDTASTNFTIAKASVAEMQPTITGTAQVGQVLSAELEDVPTDQYTWKWLRDGAEIPGANGNSYVLTYADSNKAITVQAVTTEENYTGSSLVSEAVTVAKQVIAGTVVLKADTDTIGEGTQLTADVSLNPVELGDAVRYQWYVNGQAQEDDSSIDGSGLSVFTVSGLEAGDEITVTVTPSSEDYEGSITSAPVVVGKSVLTGTLTLSESDGTITATLEGDATEEDYDIIWLRDGVEIPDAVGATYTITDEDKGHTITAKAVAKGESYTGAITSKGDGVEVAAQVPDAPVVSTSVGSGRVTVRWSAPADNGAPITGYTVQMNDEAPISLSAATTSYAFTGLTNGTEYTFKVTAVNSVGSSAATEVKATPKSSGGGGGGTTSYTLTFDTNGGSRISSISRSAGSVIDLSDYRPTREGYVFAGWYSDDELTEAVTRITLNKNTTVYAKWTEEGAASGLPFTDVEEEDWFYEAVTFVFEEGLMNGTNDGTTFSPTMTTTRSMVVTILWRMDGSPVVNYAMDFDDVDPATWYGEAVRWAAAEGVVNGIGDSLFAPNMNISREQMATMLYRYAQYLELDVSDSGDLSGFADDEQTSDWAAEAMQWAVGAGLINGKDGNRLDPTGDASRAEVATLFQRFAQLVADN